PEISPGGARLSCSRYARPVPIRSPPAVSFASVSFASCSPCGFRVLLAKKRRSMFQLASTKESSLAALVQEFERLIDQPESPVRAVRRQPATDGTFQDIPVSVDIRLRDALKRRGIERLYTHQAEAFEQIEA